MKPLTRLVTRAMVVVTLMLALAVALHVPSHSQADTNGPSIQVTGSVDLVATTGVTTTNIVQPSTTKPPTYSPNYLSGCVHTGNPAFVIANKTTTSQSVTSLPNETTIATIPAGQAFGFTVSGTFPGFVLAGLASNHKNALVVYCR